MAAFVSSKFSLVFLKLLQIFDCWASIILMLVPFNSNGTLETAEDFKYLGTTLINLNSISEEIKSRLRSGNACYNSV